MTIIEEAMGQAARRHSELRARCEKLTLENIKLNKANALREVLLAHIRETIDNFVDVDDGDYGAPKPNWAMQLTTEINTLIGED